MSLTLNSRVASAKTSSYGHIQKTPQVQPAAQTPLNRKRNIAQVDLTGDESSDSDDIDHIVPIQSRKRSRTSSQSAASGSTSVSRTESDSDVEISRLKRSKASNDIVPGSSRLVDQTPLRSGTSLSIIFKNISLYWTQVIGSNSVAIDITNRSSKYPGQHLSAVLVTGRTRPPPTQTQQAKRQQFLRNLSVLEGVSLCNDVDNDSPPINFRFIKQCVLGAGVHRATEEVMTGCECHKVHHQPKGCVYLGTCSCIQDSGENDLGKSCISRWVYIWGYFDSYSYRKVLIMLFI